MYAVASELPVGVWIVCGPPPDHSHNQEGQLLRISGVRIHDGCCDEGGHWNCWSCHRKPTTVTSSESSFGSLAVDVSFVFLLVFGWPSGAFILFDRVKGGRAPVRLPG